MTWVRLDEEFARHPKVCEAGPLGLAMQVAALCYCNQYLTDGFVPRAAVPGLLAFEGIGMRIWNGESFGGGEDASWELVAEDLIAAGLWAEAKGGYLLHDYGDYQPSKAAVLADRAAATARQAKARTNRKKVSRRDIAVTSPELRENFAGSSDAPSPYPLVDEAKASSANGTKPRQPDELFDALAETVGIDVSKLTASGRGAMNHALKELRLAGAVPGEVRARAKEYRNRYSVPLTSMALAKHWASLGAPPVSRANEHERRRREAAEELALPHAENARRMRELHARNGSA